MLVYELVKHRSQHTCNNISRAPADKMDYAISDGVYGSSSTSYKDIAYMLKILLLLVLSLKVFVRFACIISI